MALVKTTGIKARILRAGSRTRLRFALAALATAALPAATTLAATTNVVANGSFTARLTHWSKGVISEGDAGSGYPRIGVGALNSTSSGEDWSWMKECARSQGAKPFVFIDAPSGAEGYVQQQLKVPRSPGKLTFHTWGNLEPTEVTISIVTGGSIDPVLTYSPPPLQGDSTTGCSGKRPVTKSVDLAAYAGKTVGLRVQATSTGYDGTIADFDDFSLSRR
jgi:hypothetical protein